MAKNTGKEYEKLTQYIFKQIVNQNQVNNIDVQHDVVIQGKSTTHQIDVFWKFEIGGEEYSTIVQAKDWKNRVPQKEMLAFNDIIRDLPYGTRGIFVSLNGYQKGAVDVAKANGITIYELRPPKTEDWDGYIKTINLEINSRFPIYENIVLTIDGDWMRNQGVMNSFDNGTLCFDMTEKLYDEQGVAYTTLKQLLQELVQANSDGVRHTIYEFDRATFTYVSDKYVKINGIEGDIGFVSSRYVHRIDAEDFTSYVLKNIISGDSKMFDKNHVLKK